MGPWELNGSLCRGSGLPSLGLCLGSSDGNHWCQHLCIVILWLVWVHRDELSKGRKKQRFQPLVCPGFFQLLYFRIVTLFARFRGLIIPSEANFWFPSFRKCISGLPLENGYIGGGAAISLCGEGQSTCPGAEVWGRQAVGICLDL